MRDHDTKLSESPKKLTGEKHKEVIDQIIVEYPNYICKPFKWALEI